MSTPSWRPGAAVSVATAVGLSAYFAKAEEEEKAGRWRVVRARAADGLGAERVDLGALDREYRAMTGRLREEIREAARSVEKAKLGGYRSGLPSCSTSREREVVPARPLPRELSRAPLYFVRVDPGGGRPRILPAELPRGAEVLALEADSLADAGSLSRALGWRVTLASAEFARALGVRCANAEVTVSADGRTLRIREETP